MMVASRDNYSEIIVDDNLTLREVSENEADSLFGLIAANRHYLGEYLPWVESTTSVEHSHSFICTIQERRKKSAEYGFGIYFDGVLAGHISLMHLNDGELPEIGYWIAKEFSGKGITTKAARAVTKMGIVTLGLDCIVIKARLDNIASNAIPPKLGYKLHEITHEDEKTHNVWRIDR